MIFVLSNAINFKNDPNISYTGLVSYGFESDTSKFLHIGVNLEFHDFCIIVLQHEKIRLFMDFFLHKDYTLQRFNQFTHHDIVEHLRLLELVVVTMVK